MTKPRLRLQWAVGLLGVVLAALIAGCQLPQISAEERLFLPVSVDFIGAYTLPKQDFEGTPVGGISAIAYDTQRDRLYALSDDGGRQAPPRFYTFRLNGLPDQLESVTVESVTFLTDEDGAGFATDSLDVEGMALSPRNTLMIASEGVAASGAPPRLLEFDRETGQLLTEFRIPNRYLPRDDPAADDTPSGVQSNLGFEALTTSGSPSRSTWVEPFRLFMATEGPLLQDLDDDLAIAPKTRLLHYLIGENQSTLISEHVYPLDLSPTGALVNGLSEILTIDRGGHFLALERAFGLKGFAIKLYQIATGGATDTSTVTTLKGELNGIVPIRKRLVLDLSELGIPLDNLEAMTLGQPTQDGAQSLLLVSDDNFDPDQATQFLSFRLRGTS
ncbi:MAG: esterase-like activity of phytase family protein [Cyanobacteria bacterium P01_D01_bin.128]